MLLSDLKPGDFVRIKLEHWAVPCVAEVLGTGKRHCQLHGEYIGETVQFRKWKVTARPTGMFDLDMETEPELLERIASAEFMKAGAKLLAEEQAQTRIRQGSHEQK